MPPPPTGRPPRWICEKYLKKLPAAVPRRGPESGSFVERTIFFGCEPYRFTSVFPEPFSLKFRTPSPLFCLRTIRFCPLPAPTLPAYSCTPLFIIRSPCTGSVTFFCLNGNTVLMRKKQIAAIALALWLCIIAVFMLIAEWIDLSLFFVLGFIGFLVIVEFMEPHYVKPRYLWYTQVSHRRGYRDLHCSCCPESPGPSWAGTCAGIRFLPCRPPATRRSLIMK